VQRANQSGIALSEIARTAEAVNQQVNDITLSAQRMSQASNSLVEAMDTVSAVVEENVAATQKMTANTSEVTQDIENIASISEENSAAIEEVSAGAEEMNAQAEEVSAAAQSLSNMAQGLQALVSQFRLDDFRPEDVPLDQDSTTPEEPASPVAEEAGASLDPLLPVPIRVSQGENEPPVPAASDGGTEIGDESTIPEAASLAS
jgi:chromosome segregation ATPase